MAQQVLIDIVADTKKLTSGVNDANNQIESMNGKLKGVVAAAGAAASAFVLKQGVTFLKQGIDEAKEAQQTMREATTTFGEGSAALAKITEDAEKFGKAMAVDNDEILKLATQLGARLPADAQALSAELVNLAFDVEAFTAGALSAETVTNKLAKALADGELKAADLEKIVPGLTSTIYEQAEALSAAGKNQEALSLVIDAAQQKYGDAAEKNVTATQKFDTALANLKEEVGTKVLPIVEKFVNVLTTVIEKFGALPTPIQNVILGITGLVAIGGPLLTFLASAKTAMVTLGLVSGTTTGAIGATTIATNLLRVALAGLGIGLVIAAIVLLVQNWDNITEAVKKFWEKIKEVVPQAWNKVKELKDRVVGFVGDIIEKFRELPGEMLQVGINIVKGLWNGIQEMRSWLFSKVTTFFGNLLPDWVKKPLGIKSPSRVFMEIGKNIVLGLSEGIVNNADFAERAAEVLAINTTRLPIPRLSAAQATPQIVVNITAGLGTDPYSLGREVSNALRKYGTVSANA